MTYQYATKIFRAYGIIHTTLEDCGVQQYEDQVCVPIRLEGRHIGWEYRRLPPYNGMKKSLHYRLEPRGLWAGSWCWGVKHGPVWLVEDVWSAIKVKQELGEQVISLMGTHISQELAMWLRMNYSGPIYLALDKDATQKAIDYVRKYSHILPNLRPVFLSKDLKYLNVDQMLELIN